MIFVRIGFLLVLSSMCVAQSAAADSTLDFRAPVRIGLGFNGPYASPMLSVSFTEQFRVARISELVGFEVLAGIDSVAITNGKIPGVDGRTVGYTQGDLGAALSFRSPKGGALFVLSGALGPIFDTNGNDTNVAGFGFSIREELYPLYLSAADLRECEKGPAYTYVASGLSFWTVLRSDFVEGAVAASWAAGVGIDVARALLLPIIRTVLKQDPCAKHGSSDR